MNPIVELAAARHKKMRTGNFKKQMRAGSLCDPKCPPGRDVSINQLAASRGQSVVPGEIGTCTWNMLPLTGTILAANPTSITITEPNSPIGLCVERIVAIVEGLPVTFSNLIFGNSNQWMQGEQYDQNLFRPDGKCSACCLPLDCFKSGTVVSVTVTRIPDAAADADIDVFFYLIGPAIGV